MLRKHLVMLSTNLGPPRKVVLRGYRIHFLLESQHLAAQAHLIFGIFAGGQGEVGRELPKLFRENQVSEWMVECLYRNVGGCVNCVCESVCGGMY